MVKKGRKIMKIVKRNVYIFWKNRKVNEICLKNRKIVINLKRDKLKKCWWSKKCGIASNLSIKIEVYRKYQTVIKPLIPNACKNYNKIQWLVSEILGSMSSTFIKYVIKELHWSLSTPFTRTPAYVSSIKHMYQFQHFFYQLNLSRLLPPTLLHENHLATF